MAERPTEGFSISELARRLDISKATCHALVGSLIESGWLMRNSRNMLVTLGPAMFAVGARAARHPRQFVEYARPDMEFLSHKYGALGGASVPVGDEIVITDIYGSPSSAGPIIHLGQRIPLRPPLGTIYLAWADEEERAAVWGEFDNEAFDEVFAAIRERGFSVTLNLDVPPSVERIIRQVKTGTPVSEIEAVITSVLESLTYQDVYALNIEGDRDYDVRNISVPVFTGQHRVTVVLTLAGFAAQLNGSKIVEVATELKEVAARVSELAEPALRGRAASASRPPKQPDRDRVA